MSDNIVTDTLFSLSSTSAQIWATLGIFLPLFARDQMAGLKPENVSKEASASENYDRVLAIGQYNQKLNKEVLFTAHLGAIGIVINLLCHTFVFFIPVLLQSCVLIVLLIVNLILFWLFAKWFIKQLSP